MKKENQIGFTLIEMLIVVLIIAAIMAYVVPNYSQYVLRSQRAEAKNALITVAGIQERFYANSNRYGTAAEINLATLYPAPTDANGLFYTISMVNDNTSYTITATAARTQTQDVDCPAFTMDNLGQQTPLAGCWDR